MTVTSGRFTLPALETLLEPGNLRTFLGRVKDPRATLVNVQPHYLRLKPGMSALLALMLTWQDALGTCRTRASLYVGESSAPAAEKATSLKQLEPELGPAMASLDGALYLAFPNDRVLRGLPAAADARRLGNRLTRVGSPLEVRGVRVSARRSRVEVLRWKPGRRAVLKASLSLSGGDIIGRSEVIHYLRVLPPALLGVKLAGWAHAATRTGLLTPAVVDVDVERGILVTEAAEGTAFLSRVADHATDWSGLAAALGVLHGSGEGAGLALRDDAQDRAAARRSLELLAVIEPSLAPRVRMLGARLDELQSRLGQPPRAFVHGDLTADQILTRGSQAVLLDWDEAAIGDPHGDYASLLADLRERSCLGAATAVEGMARTVLGERFEPARWQWHAAAAEARLALAGLQRGRLDWRMRAEASLAACAVHLAAAPVRRAPTSASPTAALLLDRSARMGWTLAGSRPLQLSAVWPERSGEGEVDVVTARFEDPASPGVPVGWLRIGASAEWRTFPNDPALPGLAARLASGGYAVAGHRIGKRAALRALDGRGYLYLRPKQALQAAYQTVVTAHLSLQKAGVAGAEPLGLDAAGDGWWAEQIPGRAIGVAHADAAHWCEVGRMLAGVHAVAEPGGKPRMGFGASVIASRRQLQCFTLGDAVTGGRLAQVLETAATAAPETGEPAFVHGDLHPAQVVVGERTVILDWERARIGEAEDDLGNLAAHLVWECEADWHTAWDAFVLGYRERGGSFEPRTVWAFATVALVRVLAIHGWRDASRQRVTELARWAPWFEGKGWER